MASLPLARPALEGSVAVRDGRRLSFAEYGPRRGPTFLWMHGTPGGRRQIPVDVRTYALEHGIRVIGVDRPGIGSSTPHLYPEVLDFAADLELLMDTLDVEQASLVGLSGGGPYALAGAVALGDRIHSVGVLGGVAPTRGDDAVHDGPIQLAVRLAPLIGALRRPLGAALAPVIRSITPLAGSALETYAHFQPAGDKALLAIPEFKAMFLDDLLNGSRFQISAPLADLVLFTREWGFALGDVDTRVSWWHGDEDHIVPLRHGQHVVDRLRDAQLTVMPGESHLGGLAVGVEALSSLLPPGQLLAELAR